MKIATGTAIPARVLDLESGEWFEVFQCLGTYEDGSHYSIKVDRVLADAQPDPIAYIRAQIEGAGQ